jgi:integrase
VWRSQGFPKTVSDGFWPILEGTTMPKLAPHANPKLCHHKATGRAVVTLNGREFYCGDFGDPAARRKYDRLIAEWIANGRAPLCSESDLSLIEVLASFKQHAKEYYADRDGSLSREGQNYFTLLVRLGRMYGDLPAIEFGPLRLKAFRQSLVDDGLARTHVNHQVNRVRHILKWASENELLPASIFESLRCVAGLRFKKPQARETEPIRPVPDAVVNATLPFLAPQHRAMVELQRLTGMRSGEVARMRTCDINTKGDVWTYTPEHHKTLHRGHTRIVYLGPQAQEVLRPWLRTGLSEYLFQPREVEAWRLGQPHANRKTPLSYGNRPGTKRGRRRRREPGDFYSSDAYGRAIRAACEVAFGMPNELRKRQKGETKQDPGLYQQKHLARF